MTSTGAARRVTFSDVLAHREFRAVYLAQVLSSLGDQLARISVAVLVFDRTHSALLTALGYAVTYLPYLLVGPVLSTLADRRRRREVMVACDLLRLPLIAVVAIPHIPIVVAIVLVGLVATLEPPFDAARAALIPDILGDGEEFAVASTLSNTSLQFAAAVGFGLGGIIIAGIGVHSALLLDALTFAFSALMVLRYVAPRPRPREDVSVTMLADLREGAVTVFSDRWRVWLVLSSCLIVGVTTMVEALAVPYSASLGHGSVVAGLLAGSSLLGTTVGPLLVLRFVSRDSFDRVLAPLTVLTPLILALTLLSHVWWLTAVFWFVGGVGGASSVMANMLFVRVVPPEKRGRAFGLAVAIMVGFQGLLILLEGAITDLVGPGRSIELIALGVAAVTAILLLVTRGYRSPARTPKEHTEERTTPTTRDPVMPAARRGNAPVWLLNAALVAAAATASLLLFHHSNTTYIQIHINRYWLLGLFFLGMSYPLTFTLRRTTLDVSLETIPLVFGFFFLPPLELIGIKLLAVVVTYGLVGRQRAKRWVFNGASDVICTALSVAAFHVLVHGPHQIHTNVWLAVFVAVGVNEIVSSVLVALAVSVDRRSPQVKHLRALITTTLPVAVFMTFLALANSASLDYDPATGWAITIFLVLTVLAMQTFQRLSERAQALDRLYALARELGPITTETSQLAPILIRLRGLVRAQALELLVLSARGNGYATSIKVSTAEDGSHITAIDEIILDDSSHFQASFSPRRWWLPRPLHSSRRASQVISTPVRSGERSLGELLARGHESERDTFERGDVRLLEAAATQLGAALEKGRMVESLRRAAELDSLTGLANLDSLRGFLSTTLDSGPGGVLLLFDIDRFHEINDMLGHEAGDSVLVEVARRLESSPSHGALAARIGSDQFALAIPGSSGSEVARLAALAVKSRVDGSVRFSDVSADIRVTVGIARAPEHGSDAATLLRRAEMGMKAAKGHSSGIGEWEPSFERDGSRRLRVVTALRAALAQGSLHVEYQPKLRMGTGEVSGFEALVRWRDPELGLISPVEFVPLAEASGLIGPLTSFVLRHALATCKTWHDLGKPVGVAVNISARSLDEPVLVGQVAAMLTASGLEPHWLTLEITESSIMENQVRALEVLRQLRLLGVRLSIDDFGTGYSSLNQLRALPVHEVKIDRSFVDGVDLDNANRAVVQAVVQLSESLGLTTVAEGVETAGQAMTLQGLHVHQVQGYFHSRPMSVTAAADWLSQRPVAPRVEHSVT